MPEEISKKPGSGMSAPWRMFTRAVMPAALFLLLGAPGVLAQFGGGGGGPAPAAQESAPVDITGYWVSLVTEDWIERMSPDSPPSGTGGVGGFGGRGGGGVPATSDPCRAYGAGGSMRLPGRLFISWADANTLQVEMDQGTQTRLFHFRDIKQRG